MVKKLPAMQETWIRYLDWEDLLDKGIVPTPVFLLRETHWQRSLVDYSPRGCKGLDTTEWLIKHIPSLNLLREKAPALPSLIMLMAPIVEFGI